MATVIKAENISKQYVVGEKQPYGSIREDITKSIVTLFKGKASSNEKKNTIWALKDISFEVNDGEVVGIIGRNGAGKSTLLKILSRITEPTYGRAVLKGRVASLLEVGTGFHPELTGRENVFLNGALLGMSNAEIKSKFDEIVDFSGVEDFLDTPVKRYSSGMVVRLAFAVAAHLEPEIMIIDEILAVGDAQFQKKCLGKIGDTAKSGRTTLFVSHNMGAIRNLCSRCILIDKGGLVLNSSTEEAISAYNQLQREVTTLSNSELHNERMRRGSGAIRFTSAITQDVNGQVRTVFEMGETIRFKISYNVFKEMAGVAIYIGFRSGLTREIVTSVFHVLTSEMMPAGANGTFVVELNDIYIRPGDYSLYLQISDAAITQGKFEVLDDVVTPIIVSAGNKVAHSNFDPSRPVGYFSLPSSVVYNEIKEN